MIDENDEPPRFSKQLYIFNLKESASPGQQVGQIYAYDRDNGMGGKVRYQILGKDKDFFEIDRNNGTLYLKKRLDYEDKKRLVFQVRATDSVPLSIGKPLLSEANVHVKIIDEPDLPPKWLDNTLVTIKVKETAEPMEIIGKVSAVDGDSGEAKGRIYYRVVRRNASVAIPWPMVYNSKQYLEARIGIDHETGELHLTEKMDYEREPHRQTLVTVEAFEVPKYFDFGSNLYPNEPDPNEVISRNLLVQIQDANDNFPIISKKRHILKITENSAMNSVHSIPITIKDGDSWPLNQIGLEVEKGGKYFRLVTDRFRAIAHDIKIEQIAVLDYEENTGYDVAIRVKDASLRGSKGEVIHIYVQVTNLNDNKPICLTQSLDTRKDGKNRVKIGAVHEVTTQGVTAIPFDDYDGFLDEINVETQTITNLTPGSANSPLTGTLPVVSQSVDVGTVVSRVLAIEPDGHDDLLRYELLNYNHYFKIDLFTGQVKVSHSLFDDLQTVERPKGNVRLNVNTTDGTDWVICSVSLKIKPDKTPPRLEVFGTQRTPILESLEEDEIRHTFDIYENEILDKIRINILDDDEDFSWDEKKILKTTENSKTEIDLETGSGLDDTDLRIDDSEIDDNEDSDDSEDSEVFIITEKPPIELIGENSEFFELERVGDTEIKIIQKQQFDYETTQKFDLSMKTCDKSKRCSTTKFKFNILPQNEHAPVIQDLKIKSVDINETAEITPDEHIYKIVATDNDLNDEIRYELKTENQDLFKIDPNSGEIFVLQKLDSDKQNRHVLTINAFDQFNKTDSVVLEVNVLDNNDNAPSSPEVHKFTVSEGDYTGKKKLLGKITVHDQDKTEYFVFKNVSAIPVGFEMHANSGEILANGLIDYEERGGLTLVYEFKVEISDGFHSTPTTARIIVTDTNECSPKFIASVVNTTVLEKNSISSLSNQKSAAKILENDISSPILLVEDVKASDCDSKQELEYHVQTNPEHLAAYLYIEYSNYSLMSMKGFDRETTPSFTVTITAVDTFNEIGTMKVVVHVENVNDNFPEFKESESLKVRIREDALVGGLVTNIEATDVDFNDELQKVRKSTDKKGRMYLVHEIVLKFQMCLIC